MSDIRLTYKGTPYTLGFNRDAVARMESMGFNPGEISNRPMTMLPLLFKGSFLAHHKKVKPTLIDEIYDACPRKDEVYKALLESYMLTVESLTEDPEDSAGNAEWEMA